MHRSSFDQPAVLNFKGIGPKNSTLPETKDKISLSRQAPTKKIPLNASKKGDSAILENNQLPKTIDSPYGEDGQNRPFHFISPAARGFKPRSDFSSKLSGPRLSPGQVTLPASRQNRLPSSNVDTARISIKLLKPGMGSPSTGKGRFQRNVPRQSPRRKCLYQ